jgi:hypothetical protein
MLETGCVKEELTVSRLWIYLTCASTARLISSGSWPEPPATPGPETRDIAIIVSKEI